MYVPAPFPFPPDADADAHALIAAHPFATMVVADGDALDAVHVPFVVAPEQGPHGTLRGHVAKANPIWKSFGRDEALAIFHGPHAYVSPDWYETEQLVPTWNYVAVHVYGVPHVVDDHDAVVAMLADLSAANEAHLAPKSPWTMDKMETPKRDAMLKGIVAFEIEIVRLQAKRKLSQNRAPADVDGVIGGLRQYGGEANTAVADLMAGARQPAR